ncbi:MAG: cytochrome c-type biogenesis protein [Burkholderiales bacterium]
MNRLLVIIANRSLAAGQWLGRIAIPSTLALIAGLLLLTCGPASAATNGTTNGTAVGTTAVVTAADAPSSALADPSPEQARELLQSDRFRQLASELRCLVCQNQTLADSNADLATDLRNEVLRQMSAGRDDTQIKENLVARYGEFVLYRPTYSGRNLALWAGPAVLLALGAVAVWRISRTRRTSSGIAIDETQLKRVDKRLEDR